MKNPIFSKSYLWVASLGGVCRLRGPSFLQHADPANCCCTPAMRTNMKAGHTSVPAADFPCPQVFTLQLYRLSYSTCLEGITGAWRITGRATPVDLAHAHSRQPGVFLWQCCKSIALVADNILCGDDSDEEIFSPAVMLKMPNGGRQSRHSFLADPNIQTALPCIAHRCLKPQGDPCYVFLFVCAGRRCADGGAQLAGYGCGCAAGVHFIVLIATDGQADAGAVTFT